MSPLPPEIADGPAIELPPHRLELIDDLHRPHLGRAHQGAGRERRREQIEGVEPRRERTADSAHDVHDVAVALDHPIRLHAHRPRGRDAAQVIARQIDQHDVLGVLLGIREQIRLEPGIGMPHRLPRGREPAMGRSCAWPAVRLDQRLRRGAHHRDVAELAEIHVGGRIQQAQRPIDLERRQRVTPLEARREHQLVYVAGGDVLLGAMHAIRVSALRQRRHRGRERARREQRRHGAPQRPHDLAPQRLPLGLAPVVQQGGAARQVIEHQQGARRHVMGMRRDRVDRGCDPADARSSALRRRRCIPTSPPESGTPGNLRLRLRSLGERAAQRIQELGLDARPRRCGAPRRWSPDASSRTSRQSPNPMNE